MFTTCRGRVDCRDTYGPSLLAPAGAGAPRAFAASPIRRCGTHRVCCTYVCTRCERYMYLCMYHVTWSFLELMGKSTNLRFMNTTFEIRATGVGDDPAVLVSSLDCTNTTAQRYSTANLRILAIFVLKDSLSYTQRAQYMVYSHGSCSQSGWCFVCTNIGGSCISQFRHICSDFADKRTQVRYYKGSCIMYLNTGKKRYFMSVGA